MRWAGVAGWWESTCCCCCCCRRCCRRRCCGGYCCGGGVGDGGGTGVGDAGEVAPCHCPPSSPVCLLSCCHVAAAVLVGGGGDSPTLWQPEQYSGEAACHYFQCSDATDVLEWTTALRAQLMLVRVSLLCGGPCLCMEARRRHASCRAVCVFLEGDPNPPWRGQCWNAPCLCGGRGARGDRCEQLENRARKRPAP